MIAISIIIPVYNAEKFLHECLNSLINQTFKNFEIICINDGSTDSSLKIIEEYVQKDSRFKVYNQENQGASGQHPHQNQKLKQQPLHQYYQCGALFCAVSMPNVQLVL